MGDKLTTEELVKLAEYCGVKVGIIAAEDHVYYVCEDRPGMPVWHPDVDAKQWHEVLAKLFADGWEVVQSACPGDDPPYECELNHTDVATGKPDRQSQLGQADEPCEAGCRAALKVIADNS